MPTQIEVAKNNRLLRNAIPLPTDFRIKLLRNPEADETEEHVQWKLYFYLQYVKELKETSLESDLLR